MKFGVDSDSGRIYIQGETLYNDQPVSHVHADVQSACICAVSMQMCTSMQMCSQHAYVQSACRCAPDVIQLPC